jgi:hypothetical protein
MFELNSIQDIQLLFAYLLPGFLIAFVFSRFFAAKPRGLTESLINYLVLTAIYYSLTYPISGLIFGEGFDPKNPYTVLIFFILGPILFGLLLGTLNRQNAFYRLLQRLGIRMVHPVPSAWDWRFYNIKAGTFVLITLQDGSKVGGRFGLESFASSDSAERDFYLDEIWNIDEDGEWTELEEKKGVLLAAREIKYIEFWDED